jgi:hypothetical protein
MSLCVIKKPHGRGGHSLRWGTVPEKTTNKENKELIPEGLRVLFLYTKIYISVGFLLCYQF